MKPLLSLLPVLNKPVAVANRSGIPPQNFTVADETGRVGWTIIGRIPTTPSRRW